MSSLHTSHMPKQANMCMSCSNFVHHLSSSHTALVPRAQALSPRVRRSSAVCRFRCSRGTHRPPLSPPSLCQFVCVQLYVHGYHGAHEAPLKDFENSLLKRQPRRYRAPSRGAPQPSQAIIHRWTNGKPQESRTFSASSWIPHAWRYLHSAFEDIHERVHNIGAQPIPLPTFASAHQRDRDLVHAMATVGAMLPSGSLRGWIARGTRSYST